MEGKLEGVEERVLMTMPKKMERSGSSIWRMDRSLPEILHRAVVRASTVPLGVVQLMHFTQKQ